jgi:hypothetical protein
MVSNDDFSLIDALDFGPIKAKLMHRKSGQAWSEERADTVEREYRRFLYLMKKFPNERTAPLVDVDTFWHYHILDTVKYAADCQKVFGYFLHHFPYAGMRGKDDESALERMGERMRAIYEETFGEAYLAGSAASSRQPRTALSSGVRLETAYGAHPAESRMSGLETAYCFTPSAEIAYCFVPNDSPRVAAAATARHASQEAEMAYCFATDETIPEARPRARAELAYCFVPTETVPSLNALRSSENRTGFYLERPRLPRA